MKRLQQFILWIALCLPASAQMFWSGQGSLSGPAVASVTVAAAEANPCAASTNYASADTYAGLWSPSGGPATLWECVNEARGSTDTTDFIQGFMDATRTDLILRVSLPGDCDVSAITVYGYAQSLPDASVMNVTISSDNSTWTSSDDQTWAGVSAEHSSVFTGLDWVNPAYCYVKFSGQDLTFHTTILYNMQVMVNP